MIITESESRKQPHTSRSRERGAATLQRRTSRSFSNSFSCRRTQGGIDATGRRKNSRKRQYSRAVFISTSRFVPVVFIRIQVVDHARRQAVQENDGRQVMGKSKLSVEIRNDGEILFYRFNSTFNQTDHFNDERAEKKLALMMEHVGLFDLMDLANQREAPGIHPAGSLDVKKKPIGNSFRMFIRSRTLSDKINALRKKIFERPFQVDRNGRGVMQRDSVGRMWYRVHE